MQVQSIWLKYLKNEGRLYVKEPQRENDGMPIEEIMELMKSNGFYEEESKIYKGTYSAVYKK